MINNFSLDREVNQKKEYFFKNLLSSLPDLIFQLSYSKDGVLTFPFFNKAIINYFELTNQEVRNFNITPRIAMLSYSNFGSSDSEEAKIVAEATRILKQRNPSLIVDGEMQASMAFNKEILKDNYGFSDLVDEDVNVLIFPNLTSGNVAYNLLKEIGGADAIGPILLGLKKPVHVLQLGSSVRSIINMALVAVVDAQLKSRIDTDDAVQRSSWWKRLKKKNK